MTIPATARRGVLGGVALVLGALVPLLPHESGSLGVPPALAATPTTAVSSTTPSGTSASAGAPSAVPPGSTSTAPVAGPTDLAPGATVVTRAGRSRLAVGDSILVGAASLMRRNGFAVHARVGRQFSAAPAILRGFGARLPRNVVIELGTNGYVSLSTCRRVVRLAGPQRRVFLVTNRVPRVWQARNNRTLRQCDASFAPARVRLVDWHGASAGHPEWLARDRIHPSVRGRVALVRLIDREVDRHGA